MKITKQQLKQMIKEEVGNIVKEWDYDAEASKRSQWDRNWRQRQSLEPKRKRNPLPAGMSSEEEPQQDDVEVMVPGYGSMMISQIKRKLAVMIEEAYHDAMRSPPQFTHLNGGVMQALHQALKDNDAL